MQAEPDLRITLPVWLSDAEADERYASPLPLDLANRERVLGWVERAEDVQSELESIFDVAFGGDDEDLFLLDGIAESMLQSEPLSEEQLAELALDWGYWLGEWMRCAVGGEWVLREGQEHASIRFSRVGGHFFPVHVVLQRFALPGQVRFVALVEHVVESLASQG